MFLMVAKKVKKLKGEVASFDIDSSNLSSTDFEEVD